MCEKSRSTRRAKERLQEENRFAMKSGSTSRSTRSHLLCVFMMFSIAWIDISPLHAWSHQLPEKMMSTRKSFLHIVAGSSLSGFLVNPERAYAAAESQSGGLTDLLSQVQMARIQLEKAPAFIEKEKWDSVRALLLEPPLADCWAKTNRPLLTKYAEVLGDAGGDELAALEAKEELVSHLRYLDMAVYNNVFNPITVEGKSGATKELVRSYYEDPINEFKASAAALKELEKLATDIQ